MDALYALLSSPAGTFFFQLTTLVILLTALIVVNGRDAPGTAFPVGRMRLGLIFLLFVRLSLSVSGLAGVTAAARPEALLQFERGATAISWVILVWLWCFPLKSRAADAAAILTALLTITITALGIGLAGRADAPAWPTQALSAVALATLSVGLVILMRSRPELWGFGFAMLLILWLAEAIAISLPSDPAAFPVWVRLAQLAAFPILLTLPQRIVLEPVIQTIQQPIMRSTPERKRVNLPPNILNRFLGLGTEKDVLALCRGITESVSYALVADICLILSRPTPLGEIIILSGFDQVLEQEIPAAKLETRLLPMVVSAIQKHTPLRLPASSASSDLKSLSDTLRLPKSGHLLVAPIRSETEIGALLLLTPYSSRTWSQDDQVYLAQASEKVGRLLDQARAAGAAETRLTNLNRQLEEAGSVPPPDIPGALPESSESTPEPLQPLAALAEAVRAREELEAQLEQVRERNKELETSLNDHNWDQTIQHLQAENIQLQLAVDELERQKTDLQARATGHETAHRESLALIAGLHQENERLKDEIETTAGQVESIANNGKAAAPDRTHTENELKESLREIAHLRNQVGEAEIKILELENLAASSTNVTRQWETIITLAEEMRQPMSSILGYSDFLLTESVGLLGALQRKFLERVHASTNRMSAMIEDLIHVAAVESGKMKLALGIVDLTSVIDSAIAATSLQMREKSIALLVDLPEDLPTIEGDREAIRLTLIHLLHNAAAATPKSGEITMAIRVDDAAESGPFIQIRVTDSGVGLSITDLSKVFERRLKSRDQLIPGLGVSNSGLSIARTLVEAHGGRIWVENRDDRKGAVFSIVLPLRQDISSLIFGKKEI